MMAKWYSGTLGAESFLTFVLQVRKNPKKNFTQETCPDRGSNPGLLRDKHACYYLLHSGGALTLGISQSLMDSFLDCRVHEVTLPTHNSYVFWLQHLRCDGEHCFREWVAHPRAYSCEVFARKHNNTLQWHFFHMGHDDSLVIISKYHHSLDLWLSSSKSCWQKGTCSSPLVGL